ncbi:MAG TPA: hypothetical protein VM099_04515, partial [Gemmatimonadaceae bacterium]|nr:hypothetical protein [Gemmatimonadaceae bacterium]
MKPAIMGAALLLAGHTGHTIAGVPSKDVDVIATDYAFQIPRNLPPGATTFHFRNQGNHRHELNIFLLRRGATVKQVLDSQRANKTTQGLVEASVGVLFAKKSKDSPSTLTTRLLPGRTYGVICIFRDSADKPRHYDLGMYTQINISAGAAGTTLPPADTVIGVDYAYRQTQILKAGRHSFVFRNDGKHRHELSITLLKPGVTLAKIMEVDKVDGDIEPLIEAGMGVLWARPGEAPLGRLDVTLLPGREYLIDCGFQDDDKSPPHYKLGMYGSIQVTG